MKTKSTIAAILLTSVLIMAACGNKTPESQTEGITTEHSTNATFQCPMKCEGEKMYDKPGQCPVCKMELEKVEVNHEHNEHDTTHTNH